MVSGFYEHWSLRRDPTPESLNNYCLKRYNATVIETVEVTRDY